MHLSRHEKLKMKASVESCPWLLRAAFLEVWNGRLWNLSITNINTVREFQIEQFEMKKLAGIFSRLAVCCLKVSSLVLTQKSSFMPSALGGGYLVHASQHAPLSGLSKGSAQEQILPRAAFSCPFKHRRLKGGSERREMREVTLQTSLLVPAIPAASGTAFSPISPQGKPFLEALHCTSIQWRLAVCLHAEEGILLTRVPTDVGKASLACLLCYTAAVWSWANCLHTDPSRVCFLMEP